METFSVNQIAEKVCKIGNERNHNVEIDHLNNPRVELENHYYNPVFQGLIDIGVEPNYMTDDVVDGIFKFVEKYKNNIRKEVIFNGIKW